MSTLTSVEIVKKIGHGGMGEVYQARLFNEHGFEKMVAAKRVLGAVDALLIEAKVLSRINHLNICSVFDIREIEGQTYILIELIEGQSLNEILDLCIQKGFLFSEGFIISIAVQALEGLCHAHAFNESNIQILHRDISPHNLMVNTQGVVKLIDFGISKIEHFDATQRDKPSFGKLRYCAPEIFKGEKHSTQTDLYSLGISLLEVAFGQKVFQSDTESETLKKIESNSIDFKLLQKRGYSAGLCLFLKKLTEKKNQKRFHSAKAALDELKVIQKGLENQGCEIVKAEIERLKNYSVDKTRTVQTPLKSKRSHFLKVVMAFGLLLSAAGVVLMFWPQKHFKPISISIFSGEQEKDLVRGQSDLGVETVGGELGTYMGPYACAFAATQILAYPSLLLDRDIEAKLKLFNLKHTPSSFFTSVQQYFKNQKRTFEIISKNCAHNQSFKISREIYEDLKLKIDNFPIEKISTFKDLREQLSSQVLFSEERWAQMFSDMDGALSIEGRKNLESQVLKIEEKDISVLTGFMILELNQDLFPLTLNDCRNLLDVLWIKKVVNPATKEKFVERFSLILNPFPLGAEIIRYGQRFIEYKDLNHIQDSLFRKMGVCVYERINGEVVESSLRKL